ncbi:hypothetical protein [Actinomadura yumaensis]|uniref:Uncharacterized protein n=1 Tax=Actinomadura yumaensis TaxID=111807 RepID=A0ABW2CPN9_9ACTN
MIYAPTTPATEPKPALTTGDYAAAFTVALNANAATLDATLRDATGDPQITATTIDQIEPDGFSSSVGDRIKVTLSDGTEILLRIDAVLHP